MVWGPVFSPEQVMQEMPSALRLYLRSSSTWMFVSGRNKTGARLAGWRRLAKNMDRSKTRRKSPARRNPGECGTLQALHTSDMLREQACARKMVFSAGERTATKAHWQLGFLVITPMPGKNSSRICHFRSEQERDGKVSFRD